MNKAFGRIVAVFFIAATLAACATTTKTTATATRQTAATPQPVYKVGSPYQVSGIWYYPKEQPDYDETGIASWYGSQFHGRLTADGEVFDRNTPSAAHPTLPLPSNVRVTNLENGRSIVVRVNDRGPFVNGRIIDLSEQAATLLGYKNQGTARVRVTNLGRADLNGPGLASPAEQTPTEIATAVQAAPTGSVATGTLAPVPNAAVAPPTQTAALPQPAPTPVQVAPLDAIPDGKVTDVQVPAVTAIYVQAGAFSIPTNAARVAARLQSLGAKVTQTVVDGKPIYRVRIGPFQQVEDADQALLNVQELGQSDVRIVVE
jgi:rare lipoprotein A